MKPRPCYWWGLFGLIPTIMLLIVAVGGGEVAEQMTAVATGRRFLECYLRDDYPTNKLSPDLAASVEALKSKYGRMRTAVNPSGGARIPGDPYIREVLVQPSMEKANMVVVLRIEEASTGSRVVSIREE